jgi:hypothetical protein
MTTNPAQIISAIYRDLVEWARQRGGVCEIARNPQDLLKTLSEPPQAWRVILHWGGDENANENVRNSHVAKNNFYFILDGDLGLPVSPSEELLALEGDAAMLAILSQLRVRILSYRFPWLSPQNDRMVYLRTDDNVTIPEGYHLVAFSMQFALLAPTEQPTNLIQLEIPQIQQPQ